jgi:hypothetical protein
MRKNNRTPETREKFGKRIDALEKALVILTEQHGPANIPTFHRFVDGLYIREIHAPAGSIFTSFTHKTRHPFVLSQGVCDICDEYGEATRYIAPFTGVTEIGTRRVFIVREDMVWTTFHRTDCTDPDEWLRHNTYIENQTLPASFVPVGIEHKEVLPCLP